MFDDARIARVQIATGDIAPRQDDDGKNDIVEMDDFIHAEPVESTTVQGAHKTRAGPLAIDENARRASARAWNRILKVE